MEVFDGTIGEGAGDDRRVGDGVLIVRDQEMAVTLEEDLELASGMEVVRKDGVGEKADREAILGKLIMSRGIVMGRQRIVMERKGSYGGR